MDITVIKRYSEMAEPDQRAARVAAADIALDQNKFVIIVGWVDHPNEGVHIANVAGDTPDAAACGVVLEYGDSAAYGATLVIPDVLIAEYGLYEDGERTPGLLRESDGRRVLLYNLDLTIRDK